MKNSESVPNKLEDLFKYADQLIDNLNKISEEIKDGGITGCPKCGCDRFKNKDHIC